MDSLRGTREAPGKQDRPTGHQGGRKGLIGQPGRHQGSTREAGKDKVDSLRGTREAGKDQGTKDHLDSLGGTKEGTREAGRDHLAAWEAPGMHQGGRKGVIGQPGRHQRQEP